MGGGLARATHNTSTATGPSPSVVLEQNKRQKDKASKHTQERKKEVKQTDKKKKGEEGRSLIVMWVCLGGAQEVTT